MSNTRPARNRLAATTSPYLLQHANNPVDWYPWGPEALERARTEDRPILLSIGYSACHWCHVMAHESFEDEAVARTMNEHFVNIKVDREERPDLDRIYQTAHQLLTDRPGGWPLTVFLTPEQVPYFCGTYFPRASQYGLPGFHEILGQLAQAYREQREAIAKQNKGVLDALKRISEPPPGAGAVTPALLDKALNALASEFDPTFGGFGHSPKFPQPSSIERLLRHYARTAGAAVPDDDALRMARLTLRKMALGGIYDQIGGGFARYSVDNYWIIPHFEKMLYDNGQLLALYADAWQATGEKLFRRVAYETAEWALREMRHPDGAFYASLDADSEGGEGAFYLWTPDEIRNVLPAEEAELVLARCGIDKHPNFEGRWHLYVRLSFTDLVKNLRRPREELVALWQSARTRLREAREQRSPPPRDEKILTSWNALMVIGLARAARRFGNTAFTAAGEQTLQFLHSNLWRDGRLLAVWKDGRADLQAYLDDHAYLLAALLEQLQARWNPRWLQWARAIADLLVERFEDKANGGLYFTADDHEPLVQRPRPLADDACPSGNAIAALALARLGHLLAEPRYLDAAERTVQTGAGAMKAMPHGHCALITALEEQLTPVETVLIRCPPGEETDWRGVVEHDYAPARQVFFLPWDESPTELGAVRLEGRGAWICRGTRCLAPLKTVSDLTEQLSRRGD
ncbi:MAG: thioredoxin domain-containing protein [Nitrococcus sp.]|nr:thioredoxin domain-containing protein [Nitrococcus sp.]